MPVRREKASSVGRLRPSADTSRYSGQFDQLSRLSTSDRSGAERPAAERWGFPVPLVPQAARKAAAATPPAPRSNERRVVVPRSSGFDGRPWDSSGRTTSEGGTSPSDAGL